ncbi:redox-sensitive transcriptional activator SoxR [Sphingomonas colocasiae]|uniref:Redox-sensitive transcriptional activator SoxR n=1 Tax=Sphingomonas colocasiae TaxID=1848973 RepID=A0ABS7PWR3_9SPHN|nr:redox-sensitive transcriptional activator SoxR [Sphingomonas colocasiae]MBY8825802.1 redox-sensitive transcriptional activator SoxR [Sphingomonas colocasiae]
MRASDVISIGDLAARTGVAVSAIRFYEAKGLLHPYRNAGGQRRFLRSDIRRLSFILIAQQLGLSIEAIGIELAKLPDGRTPNAADWKRISKAMRVLLDARIAQLARTRDRLDDCIGCGCLSLASCALYNPEDRAAARGAGPRYVLGDEAPGEPVCRSGG